MISRRLRTLGGQLIRRWGLLPAGDPDGLGDDDTLRGQSLPFTVMVFFPDTTANLYQLRQWFATLRALDSRHRVGIVCLDSRSAQAIRTECDLPVICCGRIGVLEELVAASDIALALYVNHNVRNLGPIRFTGMLHVYLGHGESDKAASASNQVKAYDFNLVAGAAGRERLRRNLMRYDVDAHVRTVGRPQLDSTPVSTPVSTPASTPADNRAAASSDRPTVLYAPTWEGAQPSMEYSSVLSHGATLLSALLDTEQFHVTYRPHPRLGANRADYARADQHLRALVQSAAQSDPAGQYRVDVSVGWDPRQSTADLLITDISAVAGDWLSTDRPIIVTLPASPHAFVDTDTVLDAVANLTADGSADIADLVRRELVGGDGSRRRSWVEHTMGDVTPGAATARFLTVCDELIELRTRELATRAQRLDGRR